MNAPAINPSPSLPWRHALLALAVVAPVFGMAASAWLLAEPLPAWNLAAAALVLGGLSLNTWGPAVKLRPDPGSAR